MFLFSLKTKILFNGKTKTFFSNLLQKEKKMKSRSKKISFHIQYLKPCCKVPSYFLTITIRLDIPLRGKVHILIYLEGYYLSTLSLCHSTQKKSYFVPYKPWG